MLIIKQKMASTGFIVAFLLFLSSQLHTPALAITKPYIVYLGGHDEFNSPEINLADPEIHRRRAHSHHQFLSSFLGGSIDKARETIFYSYEKHINGFAALLDENLASEIAKHPNVVSVFLDQGRNLHTTHSWDFLLLERDGVIRTDSLWKKARFGEDVIIANLDTGVWPESESFYGSGYGSVPTKWKGKCSPMIPCNNKLIGAQFFSEAYKRHTGRYDSTINTVRDFEGHGTHTLSTAAGNFVSNANVFGHGNGTAKGGSPRARVAAYKVCWPPMNGSECYDSDIMKGFDTAIHDGVDILSVSLGGRPSDYLSDGIAIGAFHAVKKGMVVVCSAGNDGPSYGTVSNVAPWMITVGASTTDRVFEASVQLSSGQRLKGTSLSKALPQVKFYPLIDAADAIFSNISVDEGRLCMHGTLDPKKVKGKIVVCLRGQTARVGKGEEALTAGAAGMILCNDAASGNDIIADPHVLPASNINFTNGLAVYSYLNSTKDPKGYLVPSYTQFNTKPAPFVASFSSRGPNIVTPEILKPDICAPGVSIIAAYSEATSPTGLAVDSRRTAFNSESGTSMSCPHVAGLVGLLKTLHPHWSAAAIRSAIMTTARTRDNTGHPVHDDFNTEASPFSYGAGEIRPNRAIDPGLVYDLSINHYLDFLCGSGYNSTMMKTFSEDKDYECPKGGFNLLNFNYPSISIPGKHLINSSCMVTVTRTLKNVGKPGTYAARVRQPSGYSVAAEPSVLTFQHMGEEKHFKLNFKAKSCNLNSIYESEGVYTSGVLIWSDGKHYVRSPIVMAASAPP
ncbi:subtilisin-like protease SBT5.4 [Apium graveolens]|uniref:subtilisin-like protease SBT5.4 n=1 Tax=Apium graveolens TaxID=4045 RepID=UPI003D79B902